MDGWFARWLTDVVTDRIIQCGCAKVGRGISGQEDHENIKKPRRQIDDREEKRREETREGERTEQN